MAEKSSPSAAPVAQFDHPTTSFERFLEENLKTLLIAGGAIFVGIIGYLGYTYFSQSKATEQASAFTSAENAGDYRKVITTFPGSLAAGNAQLMLAKQLADEDGKNQDAIAELRTFVESYPDHPQRAQGCFLLGSLLLEEGDEAGAVVELDKLIADYPQSHLSPYAKLYKGDLAYQKGDLDEALKVYGDVLTSHTGTQAAQLAEQRSDRAKIDPPVVVAPKPEPVEATPGTEVPAPPPLLLNPEENTGGTEDDADAGDADAGDADAGDADAGDADAGDADAGDADAGDADAGDADAGDADAGDADAGDADAGDAGTAIAD